MNSNSAAVILCAGKGTRMNDNNRNKVAFDCAGIPVIRRIVDNLRAGGVSRLVIVVGHLAQSVMAALDGVPGVVYVYQAQQKGTGHAALCGLKALQESGYTGPCIVTMGDKIISPGVIRGIIEQAASAPAVWGVQPISANYNGGRVILRNGRPYGVVEFADAALMALAGVPPEERSAKLQALRLNDKKASKVLKKASEGGISGSKVICGVEFGVDEILSTPYANAAVCCFDVAMVCAALATCKAGNAQGEIYLTDTLEWFAERNAAAVYEVSNADDLLTFSTKAELRRISEYFTNTASVLKARIAAGDYDARLYEIYGENSTAQKPRYLDLLDCFMAKYGDKKVFITRSPGRINLMGRHVDHRGGCTNVIATDNDTLLAAAAREDDCVNLTNVDPMYPDRSFTVSEYLSLAPHDNWLWYIDAEPLRKDLAANRGDWSNYIKAACLRFQLVSPTPICGMDIAVSGNIPAAAGLSSSSSIVVATAKAVTALNSMCLSEGEFVTLCGEGEWFVGSRGGAGDHAAMQCSKRGRLTQLAFKPFRIGETVEFPNSLAVIAADSGIKAKKSAGSRDKFNAKVATYELAFMIIKRQFPELELEEFRDLAALDERTIYDILLALPVKATRWELSQLLPGAVARLKEIFATHEGIEEYQLRGVAMYGIAECARAAKFMEVLSYGRAEAVGELLKISHDGDRVVKPALVTDEVIKQLRENAAPVYLQPGAYGCSHERIDELCDLLNRTPGVYGSELVGAGLGGSVLAVVDKARAEEVIAVINREYYDKYGCEYQANVFVPSSGTAEIY